MMMTILSNNAQYFSHTNECGRLLQRENIDLKDQNLTEKIKNQILDSLTEDASPVFQQKREVRHVKESDAIRLKKKKERKKKKLYTTNVQW